MSALQGIRVLDLCRTVPGAYCSMLLGDMGADVVLVEEPDRPRAWRQVPESADPERAAAYNALGRNKRSICLDLKHPLGPTVFLDLAARADVVLEGFRPGVAARLGVGWDAVRAANPRMVYASLSGYGAQGPYAGLAGHDIDYVALAGALGMIGRPGSAPAIPMNFVADFAAGGLFAALGVTLALYARERTGAGQAVDVGMTDGVISLLARIAGHFFESGIVPRPGTHRLTGGAAEYDVYECADGRYLAVGALEPAFQRNLCEAIGIAPEPPLDRALLAARLRERTRDEWFALLGRTDACVAPVYALDEVFADPHHTARGSRIEVDHPRLGKVPQVAVAPRLSSTPGSVRSTTPLPGAQTAEILREAGYDGPRIDRLARDGVVKGAG